MSWRIAFSAAFESDIYRILKRMGGGSCESGGVSFDGAEKGAMLRGAFVLIRREGETRDRRRVAVIGVAVAPARLGEPRDGGAGQEGKALAATTAAVRRHQRPRDLAPRIARRRRVPGHHLGRTRGRFVRARPVQRAVPLMPDLRLA